MVHLLAVPEDTVVLFLGYLPVVSFLTQSQGKQPNPRKGALGDTLKQTCLVLKWLKGATPIPSQLLSDQCQRAQAHFANIMLITVYLKDALFLWCWGWGAWIQPAATQPNFSFLIWRPAPLFHTLNGLPAMTNSAFYHKREANNKTFFQWGAPAFNALTQPIAHTIQNLRISHLQFP